MPKEARNPKSDSLLLDSVRATGPGFWDWRPESEDGSFVLHDGGNEVGGKPARDLLERTSQFGEAVVRFTKKIPRGADFPENNRLVDQLVGAGTSVGANYCEADDAVSGKDFRNKIGICRKESKETMFFLRIIATSEPGLADEARKLWREAKELNLIFGSIWRKSQ